MGISGTSGVLKERGTSGMVLRTTSTAAQTSVKAISVPMLVISPASRAGTKAASRPTSTMKSRLLRAGVRNFSLICEKKGGSSPSWLMLRNTRLCPSSVTMMTEQYPNRMDSTMARFSQG
ncbi:Uncharacterised protein [Dorea longicatena]|nr:Uncharacterised protein [Dorea longicatena]